MTADASGASFQIVITVIGPGEISSWLFPLAKSLKRMHPGCKISAALLPSVFRSGAEMAVLHDISEIDAVASIRDTRRMIWRSAFPRGFSKNIPGCVLHMGGEPLLSRLLALRLRYPLFFYGERIPRKWIGFKKIFIAEDEMPPDAVQGGRVKSVGNLMVDAALLRSQEKNVRKRDEFTIALFPGSRYFQAKHLLPFYLKVARLAESSLGKPRWLVAKAEYLDLELLDTIVRESRGRYLDGDSGRLEKIKGEAFLMSDYGIRLDIAEPGSVLSQADLALCLPGTNTAELAVSGIPMMVLLPSQHAEKYPMPGLAGHLQRIPFVGRFIKILLLRLFLLRVKHVALPNRKAGEEIVPELVGKLTPFYVSQKLVAYSRSPLFKVKKRLREVMGKCGGADCLAGELISALEANPEP
jgi:lipid-A-disaccharide synthase